MMLCSTLWIKGKRSWLYGFLALVMLYVYFHPSQSEKIREFGLPSLQIYSEKPSGTIKPDLAQIIILKRVSETLAIMKNDDKAIMFLGNASYECKSHQLYFFSNIHTRFTEISKTGNTNWKKALLIANKDISISHDGILDIQGLASKHSFRKLKLQANSEALKGAFRFTVMRNPWTRMVSGYNMFEEKNLNKPKNKKYFDPIGREIVREIRGITNTSELVDLKPTFEEFVKYLVKQDGLVDKHFTPQTRIMCLTEVTYDYIVPSEYADEYSKEIWEIIQANTSLPKSYDGKDASTQSSTVDARKWLSKLDSNLINKLYEIFKNDFLIMNYSNFTDKEFPYPMLQKIKRITD